MLDLTLLRPDGTPTSLREQLQQPYLLLVFLRHLA
jgi:hypothetical protein